MEIWGQCPKCSIWFRCDTWFDRSVPTPTCQTCALSPGALRYDLLDEQSDDADRRLVSELWIG